MSSTLRGRHATRAVVVASLLAVVAAVSGFLLPTAAVADDNPVPAEPIVADAGPGSFEILASAATQRAALAARGLAAASTPAPPPRVHCPVPGSQFVDSWGFARSGGRRHKGVDMMAAYGAPILAPVAGVVRSSNSALGGLGFYLDDLAGNTYFGSHLASLDATGWVEAGTQIGTVGTSGNAGTPHLHFEIMPGGGTSVNPYPFTLAWCLQDPGDAWAEVPLP